MTDEQVDGQLDVWDVLDLVEKDEREATDQRLQSVLEIVADEHDHEDDGISVVRGGNYTFVVVGPDGKRLHHDTVFYSQIECWAFIAGYRMQRQK